MLTTRYRLTQPQMAYRRSGATYRGFCGGIGAGKSYVGALDLIRRAKRNRLYMAVGPTYPMLRDASLLSFDEHVRAMQYLRDFRKSDMVAVLGNGAQVLFRTADDPERLRGPNLSGVWLDEASLMSQEAFDIIIGRLRQAGEQGWLGATFTPKGQAHWTYKVFAKGGDDAAIFRAKTTDNPFLPGQFAEKIRRQYTDEMARQELEGEFLDDGAYLLYPDSWLVRAVRLAEGLKGQRRHAQAIGIDPAEGGDKTAMCAVDELGVIELVSRQTPDTSVVTSEALAFMRKHNVPPDRVVFDRGGGGKEHADRLRAQGYDVRTVAFGEAVQLEPRRIVHPLRDRLENREERYSYRNRRAQMYGELRLLLDPMADGQGFAIPAEYDELRRQLSVFPLEYDEEGRMKLPPKSKRDASDGRKTLTEMIGHSPDEADALVLAVHGMLHRARKAVAGAF